MEDAKQKIITISKVEAVFKKGTKDKIGYNLVETVPSTYSDKGRDIKYTLWLTKKDPNDETKRIDSKAFTQYKAKGVEIGDTIDISFKEEKSNYTDPQGEVRERTNRTIMFFNEEKRIPTLEEVEREQPPMPVF